MLDIQYNVWPCLANIDIIWLVVLCLLPKSTASRPGLHHSKPWVYPIMNHTRYYNKRVGKKTSKRVGLKNKHPLMVRFWLAESAKSAKSIACDRGRITKFEHEVLSEYLGGTTPLWHAEGMCDGVSSRPRPRLWLHFLLLKNDGYY